MANGLNDEQNLFVNTINNNILVSASAGSGKTTTMIEKLKNLILENKVPVENLLVVTFTEAAASEMKQKLYTKLAKEISSRNLPDDELNYFYEQLFQISTADIGTLHSVCRKIVSKYFHEINIEPNFGILTNEEFLNLFNQSLDRVFEKYINDADEDFYLLYESFNDKRSDLKLRTIITTIYNYLSEKSDEKSYIDFCVNDCLNADLNNNICSQYVFDYFKSKINKFLYEISEYKKIISHEKLSSYLSSLFEKVSVLNNTTKFSELVDELQNFKAPTLNDPKQPELVEIFENLKLSVETFKKNVIAEAKKQTVLLTAESFKEVTENLKVYYLKLFEITEKVKEEYAKMKRDIGKLDFSDLQIFTLQILKNETIKEELKNNYKYIFVDEYQDTNQIQEDIIQCLSNGKNLNMIGDIKQSIYAFRQCMPEIFLNKYREYIPNLNKQLILLNKNYRCSLEVVNFVNYCFNTLITENTIGINYKKDAALVCGSENSGAVEIRIINTNTETETDEESTEEQEDETSSKDIAEAIEVARIIEENYGREYYDSATKTTKKLDYKDIAILVRDSKGYAVTLYNILKAHQIPVSTTIKTTLFNTQEIKPLYSLLKLITNSSLEIDICNVLLSPLIGVTYNELVEIKQINKTDNFYNNLHNYILNGKNTALIDKLNNYNQILNWLRYKLNYSTIMETINSLVIKYDLINHYLSLPNGEEMAENIKQFIMLLGNSGFDYNLNKCLKFLKSLSNKDDFLISVEAGDNAVKILTMHKSKGLEYPCVILSNLGKQFNRMVLRSDVVLTNKLGLGINFRNIDSHKEVATIQKNANKLFELNQQLEEQIRLLYVSLTRARNFLFLTGCYNLKSFISKQNKHIYSSTTFLDLIFKSFVKHEKFGFINAKPEFDFSILTTAVNCKIKNLTEYLNIENTTNKILLGAENKELVNQMLQNFEKVNVESNEKLATKTSVTGLMREDDYVNENELGLQIGFNETVKNNLSLKIGNAYHKVMQKLNYTESLDDVKVLINNLFITGEIESEVKPYLNANKIFKGLTEVKKLINKNTKILKEQQFLLKTAYNDVVETSDNNQKVLIQGVVDLILVNDNTAILIDFKTNKTKDVAKLINSYSLQLEVYKRAVEKGLKVKVVSSKLYLFESETFIEIV